ncbi:uncharacterized protein LOC143211881 isoform X3 [Lasioglossum baleicum]|uniref:uncharacterized protein LOC143211881 isoform X3 n=1 Tax=Lasioglossum baleicum TaxID=434251 RepID=UPI003FCD27C9
MEVEKRDGATRSAVLGTRKLPACLPACLTAACLLASHPKFPSRWYLDRDSGQGSPRVIEWHSFGSDPSSTCADTR